jgi:hypothetical protein
MRLFILHRQQEDKADYDAEDDDDDDDDDNDDDDHDNDADDDEERSIEKNPTLSSGAVRCDIASRMLHK